LLFFVSNFFIGKPFPLVSLGLYSDGDASTISIYYNTQDYFEIQLKKLSKKNTEYEYKKGYYTFFMEEWKDDISYTLNDKKLNKLNDQICEFGSFENDKGNEDYTNEIFDLFVKALHELKTEGLFRNENENFFLHIEISDNFIDEEMFGRISKLHSKERYSQYLKYANHINSY